MRRVDSGKLGRGEVGTIAVLRTESVEMRRSRHRSSPVYGKTGLTGKFIEEGRGKTPDGVVKDVRDESLMHILGP